MKKTIKSGCFLLLAGCILLSCEADMEPLPSRALTAPQILPATNIIDAGSALVIYNA